MKDLASVIVLGVYATVTLADINTMVKIAVGLVTMCYYLRKWYKMEKK